MIRLAVFVLALLGALAAGPAKASVVFIHERPFGCGSLGAYVGLGDITPSLGLAYFWGARAVSCAYAASRGPALIIQRASDNATTTINVVPSGDLDVATAAAFCASTTCGVQSLIEQVSGSSSDLFTQTTQGLQPQLAFGYYGSKPGIHFIAANPSYMQCAASNFCTAGQHSNITAVAAIVATTGADQLFTANTTTSFLYVGFQDSGGLSYMVAGSPIIAMNGNAVSLTTTHSFQFYAEQTVSSITLDGTTTPGTIGPGGQGNAVYLGGLANGRNLNGYLNEYALTISLTSAPWSSTQLTKIHANQSAYWGTP